MSTSKRISIVKPAEDLDPATFKGSLSKNGYARFPKTFIRMSPYPEPDGSYRTGLDENALYIRQMSDPDSQEHEKGVVRALRKKAELLYGDTDLSSRSDFYTKMTDRYMNTDARCPFRKLDGNDAMFNMDVKEDVITYAYLRVHPRIAPSKESLKFGNYSRCQYFVNDQEVEDKRSFDVKKKINKATLYRDKFSLEKRKKIARQLGLSITHDSKEESVYTKGDDFIKMAEDSKHRRNVDLFLKFAEMNDTQLGVRDIVKRALNRNILKKKKGKFFKGEYQLAESYEDMVNYLLDDDNQDDLEAIEEDLKMKEKMLAS